MISRTLKERIIKLRTTGKTYRQIRDELGCGLGTVSYHCRKSGVSDYNKYKSPSEKEIWSFQAMYDELGSVSKVSKETGWCRSTISKYIKQKAKISAEDRKVRQVKAVINWRRRTKYKLVEYKGGKCENLHCGYDRCIEALEFHHLDPNEKDFGIGGSTRSFEFLKKEVDKCVMLCSNCHKEVHAGVLNCDGFKYMV